jgi:phosphatidylglycerol:prolipoprotein diacylglycerol transferase
MVTDNLIAAHSTSFGVFYALAFAGACATLVFDGMRRRLPLTSWLTVIACGITCALIGSRLGAISLADWEAALRHGMFPTTTGKTFPGIVVGGVIGVHLARRWLKLPLAVADPFALALPVGLAVGRIGCLLGGCCFGTPAALPWAVTYPAGSLAHQVHLNRGWIPAGAQASLPVHPVQLYEIVLLLGVIAVLLLARSRLKKAGSLFLLYLGLQSLVRFSIEFGRESGPINLVLGLKPLQLVLLGLAFGSLFVFWFRERAATTVSPRVVEPVAPRTTRNLAAVALALLVVLVLQDWFTRLEFCILLGVLVPAAVSVTLQLMANRRQRRWAVVTVAVGTAVLLGAKSDSVPARLPHISYYNIAAGGALTGLEAHDLCGNVHYYNYQEAGLGLSRTDVFAHNIRLESGLRGFYQTGTGQPPTAGASLGAQVDWRWVGGSARGGLVYTPAWTADSVHHLAQVMPNWAASLRVGPEDKLYGEVAVLDYPAGPLPMVRVGLGSGALARYGTWVRVGVCEEGVYVNPDFTIADGLKFSPMVALGGGNFYHVGLNLKYSFGWPRLTPAWKAPHDTTRMRCCW